MKRYFGAFLLLVACVLSILFIVKVPVNEVRVFFNEPITVPPHGDPYNFYNLTGSSFERQEYKVNVEISCLQDLQIFMLDFWAVNETGYGLLEAFLSWGEVFRKDYPDGYPFNLIKAYAREVNITRPCKIELEDFSDVKICLILLNFFDDPQSVWVKVEACYPAGYKPLWEPNILNVIFIVIICCFGLYIICLSEKGKKRRKKLLK